VLDLQVKDRTLGHVLERQAAAHGDRVFLDFKGQQSISYKQINEYANRVAHGLLKSGIAHGTKVAVMLPNCPEYLYCWFGLAKIGAVMVPINTAQKGDLLKYLLDKSDAQAVITDAVFVDRIREIESGLEKLKTIYIKEPFDSDASINTRNIEELPLSALMSEIVEPPAVEVKHSDPMTILFTSGTTGPSKGVVMSHHYYYHAAKTIGGGMKNVPEDTLYTCLPLFHVNAQVCTVVSALVFDCRVSMYEHFSASTFWSEIRNSGATVFLALGAMGNILYKAAPHPDDNRNNVRLAMVVPPPEDLEGFEKRYGLRVIYESFGMTEGIVAPPALVEPRRPGCCGKPADNSVVRIVDEYDLPLGPRQTGEIVLRTREPYTMMSGYYNMPEETLNSFSNLWFHTGDLGYLDEDGFLYFVGRKKESIRRRGENISAFEVECVVNQHQSVLESAAIPVPSELGEDDLKIVVVLKQGEIVAPEELLAFCEKRMAYYMVPRFVEFRDDLPKTPTQRVEKYKLQAEGHRPGTWDREAAGYRLSR